MSPGSSANAWGVKVEIFGEYGAALALERHLTRSRDLQQLAFWGLCFGVVISSRAGDRPEILTAMDFPIWTPPFIDDFPIKTDVLLDIVA